MVNNIENIFEHVDSVLITGLIALAWYKSLLTYIEYIKLGETWPTLAFSFMSLVVVLQFYFPFIMYITPDDPNFRKAYGAAIGSLLLLPVIWILFQFRSSKQSGPEEIPLRQNKIFLIYIYFFIVGFLTDQIQDLIKYLYS